jgi:hypothetical protein
MTSSITILPTSIIAQGDEPLSAAVDGETILMVPGQGCYVGLNAMAGTVWERIGARVAVSDLIAGLQRDFDGPPGKIADETMALLNRMADLGLVRVVDQGL